MKILMNRKPRHGPWGGGNHFVKAFYECGKNLGHEVVSRLSDDIDIIFMQDPRYDELGISINEIIRYKQWNPDTQIVHRVNECDARKNTSDIDTLLCECSKFTDKTIFVSEWMKEYHLSRGWVCKNTDVIINGVNQDIFKPNEKIDNGKVSIVAHHWSNHSMKGFDIYEEIDNFVDNNNEFTFTYIGRENDTFKNTKVIPPLFGEELGQELGRYDFYISASRYDPGPNHILEALACKIPTYVHADGGGAVEFAGQSHAYETMQELINILLKKEYHENEFRLVTWNECISKVYEYMTQ